MPQGPSSPEAGTLSTPNITQHPWEERAEAAHRRCPACLAASPQQQGKGMQMSNEPKPGPGGGTPRPHQTPPVDAQTFLGWGGRAGQGL